MFGEASKAHPLPFRSFCATFINMNKKNYSNIDHGITVVDAEYGQSSGVAALYLMEQQGKIAIIETGTNHSVPLIEEVLKTKNLSFDDVLYIIPTHVHLDHAGGAGDLMHLCVNAKLVIHPFGARHMIDPSKLEAGTIAVYGEDKFRALYGTIRPIDAERVIEAPDNFELDFNGRKLLFIDTPGHARHHFCVVDEESNGIFTGDTFGLSYPQLTTTQGRFIFATTTPVQFDPGALLQSIERLMSFKPKQMFLTHFGMIEPTEIIVEQLKDSVSAFSNIALDLQDETENRLEKIEANIKDYLVDTFINSGGQQDTPFCEKTIAFDCKLNAQGLDFWLSKLK